MDSDKKSDMSELPNEILHHILSRLTEKEATRTSVLSKPWLTAWQTRPALHLDPDDFKPLGQREELLDRPSFESWKSKFKNFVGRTFLRYQQQKISMSSLKLSTYQFQDFFLWNSCMELAAVCGVKELELICRGSILPLLVFEVESLEVLSYLEVSSYHDLSLRRLHVPERILCFRLKKLCLSNIYLDDETLEKIMSSCQRIEFLELSWIRGTGDFKFLDCPNLKELSIWFIQCPRSIGVEAPNLEQLLIADIIMVQQVVDQLKLEKSEKLKSLSLRSIAISERLFRDFSYKFPKLENLVIENCPYLNSLKLSNQSLRNLYLEDIHGLEELRLDCPNMAEFEYSNSNIIPPTSTFDLNLGFNCVSKIRLDDLKTILYCFGLHRFKRFLKKVIPSRNSVVISFDDAVKGYKYDTFAIPKTGVHIVSLGIGSTSSVSVFSNILDGIFSICRPTLVRRYQCGTIRDMEFVNFLYNRLMAERNRNSSKSQKIKPWEEDLKEVKVEFFKKNEEGKWELVLLKESEAGPCEPKLICFRLKWANSSKDDA